MSSSRKTNQYDSIFLQSLNPFHVHSNLLPPTPIPEPCHPNSTINPEIAIEKEIVGAISSGKSESLKPNSGQSVPIGEHYVCVSFHQEAESDCRVWEWHGHVVSYNEKNEYTQEYVYGNYFETMMNQPVMVDDEENWEKIWG